jgi:hypothetical protein
MDALSGSGHPLQQKRDEMALKKAGRTKAQQVCDAITAFSQNWDDESVWVTCMGIRTCGYEEQVFLRFDQENPERNIPMRADEMIVTDPLMKRHHDAHIRRRQEIKHAMWKASMKETG